MYRKLYRLIRYVVYGCLLGFVISWSVILTVDNSSVVDPNTGFPLTLTGAYVLNSPKICSDIPTVKALVVVHTAAHHFTRRHNIRSTFGSRDLFKEVRVVFLLGLVNDVKIREFIKQEHIKYGDTVQGNFIDSYHNLTHKGVMGLRWITEHCSNVKYVVKIDDDVIFDMWRFLDYFDPLTIGGNIFCNVEKISLIIRKGKWKLDNQIFSKNWLWPWPYCPGFIVILSGDVIQPLFEAAHMTPFIWIDDAYLFGYLPSRARGIKLQDFPKRLRCTSGIRGGECLIQYEGNCPYMGVTIPERQYQIYWNVIKKRNNKI
ncbi:hypothetical protein SNE40_010738 [Patella caerulea]|uniref:Hexosyltransferase n=1 Tax=Patella caerulea TaxID=87958 RepID=A0AAN8JWL0_PATCE